MSQHVCACLHACTGRLAYDDSPGNFTTLCIQVLQMLREVAEGSEDKIQYDDITSQYAYTQLVCPYPMGEYTILLR